MTRLFEKIVLISLIISVCFISIGIIFSRTNLLMAIYFMFSLASMAGAYFLKKKLYSMHIIGRMIFAMTIAFLIRALAVYFLNLTPQGDYAGYLSIAHQLSNNALDNKLYFGVFPHSLNYPLFLSLIYKITGEATWVPRVINLAFGVLETGFAVYIMEKTINARTGLISGLMLALNPSAIVFTLLSGAEPLYASLIMCSLFFWVLSNNTNNNSYVFLALTGIICAFSNFFRPTGIILIAALVIQLIISNRYHGKTKLLKLLTIIISFVVFTSILGNITSSVSGYKKPGYSYGWNLFIGANKASGGKWNSEDAELFIKIKDEYHEPSEIQSYFAKQGLERYKIMGLNAFEHFYNKLSLWTEEKFTTNAITEWQTSYTRFKSKDLQQSYNLIINLYNIFVISGAIIALLFVSFTNHAHDNLKILSLYIVGSILLFMVLETAGRYKGAYYSQLTILASYGFWSVIPYVIKSFIDGSIFRVKQLRTSPVLSAIKKVLQPARSIRINL